MTATDPVGLARARDAVQRGDDSPSPSRDSGTRTHHPLAAVLPLLQDTLVSIAEETTHMMIVTDAEGHILWPAEDHVRTLHSWTCAACPVQDPDSGAVIGAVDITGPMRTFHPTTIALVVAAAELAEGHLAAQLAVKRATGCWNR